MPGRDGLVPQGTSPRRREALMQQGAIYPSLRGRAVLVTGGASGIGEAIVRAFLAQGSKVGFVDIDEKAAARLVASLPSDAVAHFERCDLRDIGALKRVIASIRA